MLEHGANLAARRSLARPQEDTHRLAALHMVDVDRQEAARIVVGVEQGELLVTVHRIAGVVDVQRDGRRGPGKASAEDVHQRRRHPRRLDARRHVLQPAHGRLGTQVPTALRRAPHRQLEQRVGTQAVAVVGVLVTAGDGQHAEAQHLGQRVDGLRRIAPVPDATGQLIGKAETPLRFAQQQKAAIRGDQATIEGRRHFLAPDGWKIEGKKGIVGHGGCGKSVARVETVSTTIFYTISTNYATLANPKLRSA